MSEAESAILSRVASSLGTTGEHLFALPDPIRRDVAALLEYYRDPPPVPITISCPLCRERHIDEGVWATRRHHTHSCQGCGHTWRPAVVDTVGVRFLPGFKNEEDKS
jgi:hypothetical protein